MSEIVYEVYSFTIGWVLAIDRLTGRELRGICVCMYIYVTLVPTPRSSQDCWVGLCNLGGYWSWLLTDILINLTGRGQLTGKGTEGWNMCVTHCNDPRSSRYCWVIM